MEQGSSAASALHVHVPHNVPVSHTTCDWTNAYDTNTSPRSLTSEAAVDGDVGQREVVADEEHSRGQHCIQPSQGHRGRGLLGQLYQTVLQPVVHLHMDTWKSCALTDDVTLHIMHVYSCAIQVLSFSYHMIVS